MTPGGGHPIPCLMDVQTSLASYHPPNSYTKHKGNHHPRRPYSGKRKNLKETGLPPAKKRCLDTRVTAESTGCKKPDQTTSHPIKKEPAYTDNGVANTKSKVDVVEPPDIKPNIEVHPGIEGSFISRVAKGSNRLLIDEYPTTKTPSEGGANTKLPIRSITMPSTPCAITTRPLAELTRQTTPLTEDGHTPEPHATTTMTEQTTPSTQHHYEPEIKNLRGGIDTTFQQSESDITTSDASQGFDSGENEHRKRRHKFGHSINRRLLKWLSEGPT